VEATKQKEEESKKLKPEEEEGMPVPFKLVNLFK
jgi:hypothetical protein